MRVILTFRDHLFLCVVLNVSDVAGFGKNKGRVSSVRPYHESDFVSFESFIIMSKVSAHQD